MHKPSIEKTSPKRGLFSIIVMVYPTGFEPTTFSTAN